MGCMILANLFASDPEAFRTIGERIKGAQPAQSIPIPLALSAFFSWST